jgi:uncharacterized protein
MLRFLILIAAAYLIYRLLRKKPIDSGRTTAEPPGDGEVDDLMIQDPYCGTYFPKRDAVHVRLHGKDFYFCSQECKQSFITEQTAGKK